jgi:lysozyme family protein
MQRIGGNENYSTNGYADNVEGPVKPDDTGGTGTNMGMSENTLHALAQLARNAQQYAEDMRGMTPTEKMDRTPNNDY